MSWLIPITVPVLLAGTPMTLANFDGDIMANSGSFFAPELTVKDLSLIEGCNTDEGNTSVEYQRCMDAMANDVNERQCGYLALDDDNVTFWNMDVYSGFAWWSSIFMFGGSSVLDTITTINDSDTMSWETDWIEVLKGGAFWANWTVWLVFALLAICFWLSMFFNLYCFCCCKCCRKCYGTLCCRKCCNDRPRVAPFWVLSKCKVCWVECYNWWFHIIIGIGLFPLAWYATVLTYPATYGELVCSASHRAYSMIKTNDPTMWSFDAFQGSVINEFSSLTVYPTNRDKTTAGNTCSGSVLGGTAGTPLSGDPTDGTKYLLNREDHTWIATTGIVASNNGEMVVPVGYSADEASPTSMTWGCAWQNPLLSEVFVPYYQRFGWGRIARSMGASYTIDESTDLEFVSSFDLFPTSDSFVGNPMSCHSEGLAESQQPGCNGIRSLRVDYYDATHPSILGSSSKGRYTTDTDPVALSDPVALTSADYDYRPDEFFNRIDDKYSRVSYHNSADDNIQFKHVNSVLDHVLSNGVVEGPLMSTVSALIPSLDFGSELDPDNESTQFVLSEISTLLTRAHALSELSLSDGTAANPTFLDASLDVWTGEDAPNEFKSLKTHDYNLKQYTTATWDAEANFIDAKLYGAATGRETITRLADWSFSMDPSIKTWVDFYRTYGPPTDAATDTDIDDPTVMIHHDELGLLTAVDFSIVLDPVNYVSSLVTEPRAGWLITQTTQEQMPFLQFHKYNLAIDWLVDSLSNLISTGTSGNTFTSDFLTSIDNVEEDIASALPTIVGLLHYGQGLDLSNKADIQNDYKWHYWGFFSVACFFCVVWLLWLGSFILFMTLACRKCCKKDPSRKSAGHIYRGMCLCMCTEMWLWMIIMVSGSLLIPTSGEVARICDSDALFDMGTDSGDSGEFFPSDTDPVVRVADLKACFVDGLDLTDDSFDDSWTIFTDETQNLMGEYVSQMELVVSSLADNTPAAAFDSSKWSMPIPGIAAITHQKDFGVPSTSTIDNVIAKIEPRVAEAKSLLNGKADSVVVSFPRGMTVRSALPGTEDVVNIGMSPYEAALSVVSPELSIVSLASNDFGLHVSAEVLEVLSTYAGIAGYWNSRAADQLKSYPLWFGGASTDYATDVDCTDATKGTDLVCFITSDGTTVNTDTIAYRKTWQSATSMNDAAAGLQLVLEMDTPDYSDQLSTITSDGKVPSWATAVHQYLRSLAGAADDEDYKKAPADRTGSPCAEGTSYRDVCVLSMDSLGNMIEVAGRCSLPDKKGGSFQPENDCAQFYDLDETALYEKMICIYPLKSSTDVGDVYADTDITVVAAAGDKPTTIVDRWSGLVPGLKSIAGGRVARFVDPICPLFCEDDVLSGVTELFTDRTLGVGKESDYDAALWFGSVSFHGKTKPLLNAFFHPTVPNASGTKQSPMKFLQEWRQCIMPADTKYPITADFTENGPDYDAVKDQLAWTDDHKKFLRLMADFEYIQALTSAATEYQIKWDDSREYDMYLSRGMDDMDKLPTVESVQSAKDIISGEDSAAVTLLTDEISSRISDLQSTSVFVNKIIDCNNLSNTVNETFDGLCMVPVGMLAGYAWLAFLLGWVFLVFFCCSFKQMHYWINRNAKDAEEKGEDDILVHAYYGEEEDVAKILNKDRDAVFETDYNHNNCLHMACFKNQYNCAQVILNARRDDVINSQNSDHYTPLHVACYENHIDIVKLLFEHNCDPDIRDEFGDTALSAMVRTGNKEMVELLVENGAKIEKPTISRTFPVEIAKMRNDEDIENYLESKAPLSGYENRRNGAEWVTTISEDSLGLSDSSSSVVGMVTSQKSSSSHSHNVAEGVAAAAAVTAVAAVAMKEGTSSSSSSSSKHSSMKSKHSSVKSVKSKSSSSSSSDSSSSDSSSSSSNTSSSDSSSS
eukprot:GHVH01004594.1.p1 GENE.GHVH01004594.1~~GHVH01004594.1.p1  ORF type:complete len:1902 (+),score=260.20 GHVH01004594.1:213-5918(+)